MKWLVALLIVGCAHAEQKEAKQYRTIFGEGNKAIAQLDPDGKSVTFLNGTKPEEVIHVLVGRIDGQQAQVQDVMAKQQSFETEVRRIFKIEKTEPKKAPVEKKKV